METADIVVIGAGAAGCAAARYLLELEPGLRVVLLDRHHVGAGSTSRSTAAFRHQWSVPAHVAFSTFSARAYDEMAERGHPIRFRRNGYLFLFTDPAALARAAERVERQRALGVEGVEVLPPEEIAARVPCGAALRLDALAGATWGPGDGFLDPLAAAQAFLDEARARGLVYRPGAEVAGIDADARGASGVRLADGSRIAARRVVCAAGAWSPCVARLAGLTLPIRPAKRYLYHSHPVPGAALGDWPMIIAPGGAHTRPSEGNTLLMAWERRPAPRESATDAELWEEQDAIEAGFGTGPDGWGFEVLAALAALVPRFEEHVGLRRVTSGWYDVSPDHKAILGEDPRLPGLFHASGFSGHGIMHAPATGRTTAELVLGRETGIVPRDEVERGFALAPLLEGRVREPVEDMVL